MLSSPPPPSRWHSPSSKPPRTSPSAKAVRQTRWYAPRSGDFLSRDPDLFTAGDANLYRYTGNDPVNAIDPTGTKEFILNLEGYNPNAEFDRQLAKDVAIIESQQFFSSVSERLRSDLAANQARVRHIERGLSEAFNGQLFTLDALQVSPEARLVTDPTRTLAFNIIPFAFTGGRSRYVADVDVDGLNFKVIFSMVEGRTTDGRLLAAVQGVKRANPGARFDTAAALARKGVRTI